MGKPSEESSDKASELPTRETIGMRTFTLGIAWLIVGMWEAMRGFMMWEYSGVSDLPADFRSFLSLVGTFEMLLGLLTVVAGILTVAKARWAIYAGLVLSYVLLLKSLAILDFIAIIFLIIAIIQAHRAIGFVNQIRNADLPLDVKG